RRDKPDGGASPAYYLGHADGFAVYRLTQNWNDGLPNHELVLEDFAAITPAARLALWHTLLNMDLVGTITTRVLGVEDPLEQLLVNQRHARTVALNDGVWVKVLDPAIA
ncbi:MAG TPA: hypothetical protein PLV68_11935, partial [Ilumatobacteraceae bacterium]|nr:hypothetical protein [Ilumatobacteraceae bacterium]